MIPLTVGIVVSERARVDRRGAGIALVGRVPGVIIGSAAVALTGSHFLAVLVGANVLAAWSRRCGRSASPPHLAHSRLQGSRPVSSAPPPVWAVRRWRSCTDTPRVTRSTLSAFFTVGSLMSVAALMATGSLGTRQWQLAALLVPGALGGLVVAQV